MIEDLIVYTPMYIGLFWAVVLFSKKQTGNRAKTMLAIQMLVVFVMFLSLANFYKQSSQILHIFEPLYIFSFLSLYPLFFWYIKLLTIETDFKAKNLIMFIPAVFSTVAFVVIFIMMDNNEKHSSYIFSIQNDSFNDPSTGLVRLQKLLFSLSKLAFVSQAFYFVVAGHRLVKRYNQRIAEFFSNLENKSINWVNLMLFSMVASLVITIVYNILSRSFFIAHPVLLLAPNLILGILVFIQGFLGFLQNFTVYDLEKELHQSDEMLLSKNVNTQKLKEKLLELFINESVFKNPDLKITNVSERLFTNRTYISKMINSEFSCTFSDYVNQYRVAEAKRLLAEQGSKQFSLEYIAEKSGFGSMVNFMRVFREKEGMTPGSFRELHSGKL